MTKLQYTFAELLRVFFAVQSRYENVKDLAVAINKSERTVRGWMTGQYAPRDRATVIRIAQVLSLTPQQTDLLLYAANESWIAYGTPVDVLRSIDLFRYREYPSRLALDVTDKTAPDIATLETSWALVFADDFTINYQSWGIGVKDDGVCRIRRSMRNGVYTLRLVNRLHDTVFMGGDSSCFAPHTYLLSVHARLVEWQDNDDGPLLVFEEISDNCSAFMRIREQSRQASVVQTRDDGRNGFIIYLNRVPAPAIRPGEANKLSIVAVASHHWFYVNNSPVGHAIIPRLPRSRLDVGVAAGLMRRVTCQFSAFRVYAANDGRDYLTKLNHFGI